MSPRTLHGHRVCPVILTVFLLGAAGHAPTASLPSWFWGCWVVTKVLRTPGISGLSPKEEGAIIGTRLVFTPSCARSGGTVVSSPEYSTKVLSEREFFDLGYVPLNKIGVREKQVTEVRLVKPELCDLEFPGNYVYLRRTDIVIDVENVYFVAKRARPGDPACTCKTPEAKSPSAQSSEQDRACWEKARTQAEMNACANEEARRADAELNRIYDKLLSKAEGNTTAVAKIKAVQTAWIAHRDAYIDAMYPAEDKQAEYGSAYPMEVSLLRAKLTRQQMTALIQLLQQYSKGVN